ncbi:type 1 glutamine amidotransferase [Herbidospora sp. NBRC 101105]|uniref:type 1 glutamine amidotransferase n=1 Tax=Herbidospora sp. NBRC 101105 TaxID=3032195 RepID=UPI0025554900|nr:type 1 glutamine amidotransferase [Herbidospora sp. NBRC 101105]
MSARVTVIEHEAEAGLGYFAGWLGDVVVHRPYLGDALPDDPGDGLLVLGGAASAWDDENHPWLPATRALLRAAVEHEVPTLGVCLGAQLMTLACGGQVTRGGNGLEVGLGQIVPVADDRLLGHLTGPAPAIQYHQDAMTVLPDGAVLIATGAQYPHQAFRIGHNAWGVQFHPEATPAIFAQWTTELTTHPAEELNEQVSAAEAGLVAAWRPLAEAFAAVVAENARSGSITVRNH